MDTKEKILDVAQRMTQTRGFNGFSYIDLSKQIGIKTSSIHYYFKSKDDLAVALIRRAEASLVEATEIIDRDIASPLERLKAFAGLFREMFEDEGRFCLCGMMSAEFAGLPTEARKDLQRFFQKVRVWLNKQFAHIDPDNAYEKSVSFISALEGALLIARAEGNPEIIDMSVKTFLREG